MRQKITTPTSIKKVSGGPERGVFFISRPARLLLSDGASFGGNAPATQTDSYVGEVVFNTGMTGYVESLTDPSYAGQILVFTYPLIGNYGVWAKARESNKIQVSGVVVSEAAPSYSHSDAEHSLLEWLESENVPVLSGVDTRALTKHLRTKGTMLGAISQKKLDFKKIDFKVPFISIPRPISYNTKHAKKIILVDCGTKANILRKLLKFPIQVKRVPLDYDYTREKFDGVVVSNGPGDPADYHRTTQITRQALAIGKPFFGICLGSQILGLAAGAKTYKLPFGHRGHNQPCQQPTTGQCFITSQNHGYAVAAKSLPKDWRVSFYNLNDGSVEGIEHKTKPFFSVQFHPEASPGPTDTAWLFDRFYQSL